LAGRIWLRANHEIPVEEANLQFYFHLDSVFFDSDILFIEHKNYGTLIKSWIGGNFTHASLCWRATRDGWSSSTFHSKCDNKKPTVTLVKVGSYIFGGYATVSWEGETIVISLLSIISFQLMH
jgi:hypothetical protein